MIRAVNEYFDVANWDFGETFYYTELSAYIQKVSRSYKSNCYSSRKQVPRFGNLFQIKATSEELFLSTARVTDVEIVKGYTEQNLRIGFTSSDDDETQTITTSSNTTTSVGPYAVYGTENSGGAHKRYGWLLHPCISIRDAALSALTTNTIHVHSFVESYVRSYANRADELLVRLHLTPKYTLYTTDTNTQLL